MGRLIDEEEIYKRLRPKLNNGDLDDIMLNLPPIEAIPQADYEARLKADLEAILVELQLEINEIPINKDNSEPFRLGQACAYDKCENLIQVKIDKLKEVEE